MLRHRKSLLQTYNCGEDYDEVNDNSNSSPCEFWGLTPTATFLDDNKYQSYDFGSPQRSDAASPTSSYSSYESDETHSVTSTPDSRFMQMWTNVGDQTNKNLKSRRHLLQVRKQTHQNNYNVATATMDFEVLKKNTLDCSVDRIIRNNILCAGWKVLENALSADGELPTRCIEFFEDVAKHPEIEPETILFVLQQGFIYSLRDYMNRYSSPRVINLLLTINELSPRSTPYLIELLTNQTQILRQFDEQLSWCTREETDSILQLYEILFKNSLEYLSGDKQAPIIPTSLTSGQLVKDATESFNPTSTLRKLIHPTIMHSLVLKFIKQDASYDELTILRVLNILASCLNFILYHSHGADRASTWVLQMLNEVQLLEIAQSLQLITRPSSKCAPGVQILFKRFMEFHENFLAVMEQIMKVK